ncbi:A24 family peptidase [Agrobacterium vitis]
MLAVTLSLIMPLCLALAAFTDLFEMKIPNAIPLVLLIGFAALALVLGPPIGLAGLHLTAGLIVFFGCFTLFAVNVMGGGDAKLLTAAAVWYGFNISLVEFLIEVAVFGGVLTLMILALRSQANTVMALGLRLPRSLIVEKKIPYGIAIAIGGFCSFPSAPVVTLALATVSPK